MNSNPTIVSTGDLSWTRNGNVVNVSGTGQITSVTANVTKEVSKEFKFTSSTETEAIITCEGQTYKGYITGCNTSTTNTNLVLNGDGYITLNKDDLISKGWINASEWDIENTSYRLTIPKDYIASVTDDDGIRIDIEL